MIFWELFVSYLKIGFFGFGGGYAMLSLIQNEVVVQHAWMTNAEFADIVAVSQITPGPIAINSATYVGYTVGMQSGSVWYGILGSVIATFAVCLPSMTLMILVARYIARLKGNPLVSGAMRGLRPVVIGMIGAAALLLMFPQDAGRRQLHRLLELDSLRRRTRRLLLQTQSDPADRPLGCRRHRDLSLTALTLLRRRRRCRP